MFLEQFAYSSKRNLFVFSMCVSKCTLTPFQDVLTLQMHVRKFGKSVGYFSFQLPFLVRGITV
jgi:hypothetical protein